MDKNAFLISLSESNSTDFGLVDFASLPFPQKVFSAIWALESHVNNGGFESFLEYEDRELVAFTAEALMTIGAESCADIVRRAIDAEVSHLVSLDAEFYLYPDDLTELLYNYVFVRLDYFHQT